MSTVSRIPALRRAHLSGSASAAALGLALLLAAPAGAQTSDQTTPSATANPNPPANNAKGTPGDTQPQPNAAPAQLTPNDTAPAAAAAAAAGDSAVTGAAATAPDDQTGGPDIVVTGFRAALRSSTAKKKNSDMVVESVTAEDIGKLPDNGIGESIARLPGLAAQRSNGRANIISIRGFGPDFSTTTLNGRQQTTTNDSRAVEFDQYPSEILAGVDVYKTAEADHTAGGLVGSIDLRTIRPLDVSHRVLAVGARGVYVDQKLQPDSDDKGYRVYGTYVDKFMDGRVGVSLSAAYSDEPYQTRDFNAWGFDTYGAGTGGLTGTARTMSGFKSYFESDKLKRFGTNATVEAQLDDHLVFTVDGFYSHFEDDINQRGFEMPLNFGAGNATVVSATASNGLVTGATVMGKPVIENYATDRNADQYAVGWNARYDNEGWHALGDFSWSRTDRTDHNLETTAGLGRNLPGTTATVSYQLTDKGPQFTSNYNGASNALVLTDVEGWSSSPVQAGYDKLRKLKDDLVEARGEVARDIGGFLKSIKIGSDYVWRTKTLNVNEGFLSPPNGANSAALPSQLVLAPTVLDRGLGPILSYDPRGLVANGVLVYTPNTALDVLRKPYSISENVWTPYGMLVLDGQLGGFKLTGNVGVQGVHTDVTSRANGFTTINDSYWMVLPSANLNFRTNSDFVIRLAASKEFARARVDDLNNAISVSINNTVSPIRYEGSGGNPLLRPYQAWSFDANIEKYFGNKGYVAIQGYYKDITTYIADGFQTFDFTSFPKPIAAVQPTSQTGLLFSRVNTDGGYLYGVEVAGTLPFEVFSPVLNGFGLTGGGSYSKTQVKDFNGNITTIPGYSKWVANATLFYDNRGISVRGSMRYRSEFLGDFAAFDGQPTRQLLYGETTIDAQIGYDFSAGSKLQGLSLYVQGQNLTDERTKARPGDLDNDLAVLRYQTFGRRVLAGFTMKF